MILAISRFKVINELEQEVKEAFFNRPHLQPDGFILIGEPPFALRVPIE